MGIFGLIRKGRRRNITKQEISDLQKAERDARGKLEMQGKETKTIRKLIEHFESLPNFFVKEARRRYISEPVSKILRLLRDLGNESLKIEEGQINQIRAQWRILWTDLKLIIDGRQVSRKKADELRGIKEEIDGLFKRLEEHIKGEIQAARDEATEASEAEQLIAEEMRTFARR